MASEAPPPVTESPPDPFAEAVGKFGPDSQEAKDAMAAWYDGRIAEIDLLDGRAYKDAQFALMLEQAEKYIAAGMYEAALEALGHARMQFDSDDGLQWNGLAHFDLMLHLVRRADAVRKKLKKDL